MPKRLKSPKNHNWSHFSLLGLNFNMRLFPCIFHLKPYSVFDSMFKFGHFYLLKSNTEVPENEICRKAQVTRNEIEGHSPHFKGRFANVVFGNFWV